MFMSKKNIFWSTTGKDDDGFDIELRVYPMEKLKDESVKFSEDEIDEFISGSWLYESMCVGSVLTAMNKSFECAEEVYRMMQNDPDWFKKVTWTKEQRLAYENEMFKVMKRFLEMDDDETWYEIEQWGAFGSCPSLDDYNEENFCEYMRLFNKRAGWEDAE